MRLSKPDWEEYCKKSEVMREHGVQVGDVLICDEGARPKFHEYTKKPHVRITEYCLIDGTGPRFFVHGFRNGLVAYVPDFNQDCDETQVIPPGTEFRVVKKFEHSVVLKEVKRKE